MPDKVDETSPNDVWIVIDAYWEKEQAEWERARAMAYNVHLHAPYMKNKKPTLESFWPFGWDKEKHLDTFERIRQYKENLKKRKAVENAN